MKKLSLICLIITILSISVFAQWSADPAENNAIALASGEEAIPKVATSENGTTYIAWFSNVSGSYDVRLQKLDVFGNIQWDSDGLLVSDHPSMTWLTDWDMTIDHEDHAILTFQDIRNGSNDVFAYRISPDGDFLYGEDGVEMSTGPAFDASPKVCVTNSNNAVFAWQAEDVVIIQKISQEGNKLWGDDGITLSSNNTLSWPQLLTVGDDDVILKYFDDSGLPYAPTRHVYAQRFDSNGNLVWAQPTIVSNAAGISAWTQVFPFINDGEDGFYIAWHDDRDMDNQSSIFVHHIGADGVPIFMDDGIEASLATWMNHFYAQLVLPPGSDDIFVYWRETNLNQSSWGIYGQKISASGDRLWTDNGQSFVDVSDINVDLIASGNSNEDMVVFYEEYSDVMNAGIKAMRIDTDGNFVWENEKIDMCTVQSEKVHSVVNSFFNGQWIASWEDSRNGGKDIYAQNVQLDGSLGPVTILTGLTVTPDTIICDTQFGHFVYIANYTNDAIDVTDIYFEEGYFSEFMNSPSLPYTIEANDSLIIEFLIIGSTSYNPEDYYWDIINIESEVGNYHVDVGVNSDLLESIRDNNKQTLIVAASPNPAKDQVTFILNSDNVDEVELLIFDSFGKSIKTFRNEIGTEIIWDCTNQINLKVDPGVYYGIISTSKHTESIKIILY